MTFKNKMMRIRIDDINPDGNGVGRAENGIVVFVPQTAPGDLCDVLIIKETSGYLVGKMIDLVSPSEHRTSVSCPVYSRCGSCCFLHLSEEYENAKKREIVRNAFLHIAKMDVPVEETRSFAMAGYRNKVVYPLSYDGQSAVFGYYARHSHAVVQHECCPLQDTRFSAVASFVCRLANELHIPIWNESASSGILRFVSMRKNRAGRICVTLVASKRFKEENALAKSLIGRFQDIQSVFLNINSVPGNAILGEKTVLLSGESDFYDSLCGRRFKISPASFYQIHPDCAESLYNTAAELLNLSHGDILLDLYCGIGSVGLSIVDDSQKLFGVEIVPDAVSDAWENASGNGRSEVNTHFICADASIGIALCQKLFGHPSAIIVDPPRKGLSNETISLISGSGSEKVLYISCNPASLARDVSALCSDHYRIGRIIPFNMFPRTGHVETVVLLSRKNIDDHLEFTWTTDDFGKTEKSKCF